MRYNPTDLLELKAQAKAKLKAGNKVPTRAGAPLKTFEQFRADAGGGLTEELTKKQKDHMEQVSIFLQEHWILINGFYLPQRCFNCICINNDARW
jgi:hypothetical protein